MVQKKLTGGSGMGNVVLQQGNASGAQFHVKDPISALTHFIAFVAAGAGKQRVFWALKRRN